MAVLLAAEPVNAGCDMEKAESTARGKRAGAGRPRTRSNKRLLLRAPVLLEGGFPVLGQTVEGLFGGTPAGDDERMEPLVGRGQQLRVLGHGPEVLHHEHRLVEGLVVRRGLAEG